MTSGGGQAWAQGDELIVQSLLGHPAVGDQTAPVPHRGAQRLHAQLVNHQPAGALPGPVGRRRAVTVVGLEPARPQHGPGGLGLPGREQPHPTHTKDEVTAEPVLGPT